MGDFTAWIVFLPAPMVITEASHTDRPEHIADKVEHLCYDFLNVASHIAPTSIDSNRPRHYSCRIVTSIPRSLL
jgi:hypothetical protein